MSKQESRGKLLQIKKYGKEIRKTVYWKDKDGVYFCETHLLNWCPSYGMLTIKMHGKTPEKLRQNTLDAIEFEMKQLRDLAEGLKQDSENNLEAWDLDVLKDIVAGRREIPKMYAGVEA